MLACNNPERGIIFYVILNILMLPLQLISYIVSDCLTVLIRAKLCLNF